MSVNSLSLVFFCRICLLFPAFTVLDLLYILNIMFCSLLYFFTPINYTNKYRVFGVTPN